MRRLTYPLFLALFPLLTFETLGQSAKLWHKFEIVLQSSKTYSEPLYEVANLTAVFESPSGRTKKIQGFWDGDQTWKVRFMPDEPGTWRYQTECSDRENPGLHQRAGTFTVTKETSPHALYTRGALTRPPGRYHLAYADGKPFFWFADTAWNGALKATEEEWDLYLQDRAKRGFNVIQVVLTQWRGLDADENGQRAFEGAGRIQVNPKFFQRLDQRIDRINEHGLAGALVLLWALPVASGRHLSPGYYLPEPEAILLAKYMVARYGANQVVWFLGGDGRYVDEYEQRWKTIGRGVFGPGTHQGLVAQHPQGISWIGDVYSGETWLDIVGYQSSHSPGEATVNWINRGPMAERWDKLPARPLINLEPLYENATGSNSDDVRKACYWSVFATPVAGITYGAHAIWPWLNRGEYALNHGSRPSPSSWRDSLGFPGVVTVSYLARFMQRFRWWEFRPRHQELLVEQPGLTDFRQFISVLGNDDASTLLVYVPVKGAVRLRNPRQLTYQASWFNPVTNQDSEATTLGSELVLEIESPYEKDAVLVLKAQ